MVVKTGRVKLPDLIYYCIAGGWGGGSVAQSCRKSPMEFAVNLTLNLDGGRQGEPGESSEESHLNDLRFEILERKDEVDVLLESTIVSERSQWDHQDSTYLRVSK